MAESAVVNEPQPDLPSPPTPVAAPATVPSSWLYAFAVGLALTLAQLGLVIGICALLQEKTPAEAYASLYEWDSRWYNSIVTHGYRSTEPLVYEVDVFPCNVAFFPGYPAAAWAVKQIFGLPVETALLLAAQLCCWGFWTYVVRFFQMWQVPTVMSREALLTIFVHPAAYYLVSGYSESLFLLAMLGFFYWSERRGPGAWLLAAAHGFAMTGTRMVGLPLVIYPLLVALRPGGTASEGTVAERLRKAIPALLLGGVASLGGLLFFAYCQARFGEWNLYMRFQEFGWGVRPDYLGLFDPRNLGLYTLDWDMGAHALSRFSVPLVILLFVGVALAEWRAARISPSSGLPERLGLYLAGAIMFYLYAAGLIGNEQVPLRSMIRYSFCVHAVVVLGLVHLLLRVQLFGGLRTVTWYCLLACNAIALALQIWLIRLFTNGSWVA